MLLPSMLRKKAPAATIGFFLHIPFPSYEVFRMLPSDWRREILKGLYGADLVGFHTHEYSTHFLRSTLRILGHLDESERLLVTELDRHLESGNSRALHDEARATLALTYVAQGRAAEAAGLALSALAPHLSRYNRSVSRNAAELVTITWN